MSRFPMATTIARILAHRPYVETKAGESHAEVVSKTLSLAASIARETAQASWTLRQFEDDRDDLMEQDVDELARQVMQIPWWLVNPNLPVLIDGALRDAFFDEHFKLEDPEGWAEVNADVPTRVLH